MTRRSTNGIDRNTPTHVGKTMKKYLMNTATGKHPHARGEDPEYGIRAAAHIETPPRTWGRHGIFRSAINSLRNTPTHVGKTPAEL